MNVPLSKRIVLSCCISKMQEDTLFCFKPHNVGKMLQCEECESWQLLFLKKAYVNVLNLRKVRATVCTHAMRPYKMWN